MKHLYVHIGQPKTGTTAVQFAAKNARSELLQREGIEYITSDSNAPHALHATLDLIGSRTLNLQDRRNINVPKGSWNRLKSSLYQSEADSAFISSEALAAFSIDDIVKFRSELEPLSFHLIISMRSLFELIPSQWQQWVRGGEQESLNDFVQRVITEYNSSTSSYFWNIHNTAEVAQRWLSVLKPERATLIAVSKSDQEDIFRHFEQALSVSQPTLVAPQTVNPSLTLEEATFIQLVRKAAQRNQDDKYLIYVPTNGRKGHILNSELRARLAKNAHRVSIPDQYVSAVLRIQDDLLHNVEQLRLNTLGNPSSFRAFPTAPAPTIDAATITVLEAAAEMTYFMMRYKGNQPQMARKRPWFKVRNRIKSWVDKALKAMNATRRGG